MHRIVLVALLASAAMCAVPTASAAAWTRLSSDHFVFVGDASEREIRNIARRLEQFRDVVGNVISSSATVSSSPTVVLVFRNDRSFTPFKPVFQGKPVEVSGVFAGSEDIDYIALNVEQDADAFGIIFHEYAHALMSNTVGSAPPWLNEGLAQLYQTFETGADGRSARIGRPIPENLELLQSMSQLMPLTELVAVDHNSPVYNEGNRRTLFYAESWALVHYLTFGSPARAGQLRKYINAIRRSGDDLDAFRAAFGQDVTGLEREVREYVRRLLFVSLRLEFQDKIFSGTTTPATTISDNEAGGYLGDLLVHLNRQDEARTYLRKIIDAGGNSTLAKSALGRLELRSRNEALALQLLEQAANAVDADVTAMTAYGRALTTRADRGTTAEESDLARARAVLSRALDRASDSVTTMVALASVELQERKDLPRAAALLRRALERASGREDYALMLADALAMQGDYQGATDVLGSLVAHARRQDIKDAARRTLSRVADARNTTASREARGTNVSGSAVPTSAGADVPVATDARTASNPPSPSSPSSTAASAEPRPLLAQGSYVLILRPVGTGETRVLGTFAAVECRSSAIVLQIDAATGPIRIAAPGFPNVEFFSYRQDPPGGIPCGPQQPAFRVLATYRDDAPIEGTDIALRAVAIEVLPDGYTPK